MAAVKEGGYNVRALSVTYMYDHTSGARMYVCSVDPHKRIYTRIYLVSSRASTRKGWQAGG